MEGYLGEIAVHQSESPYSGFTATDWALEYIAQYKSGDHHDTWVLDQVARILHGTPVELKLARWSDGQQEWRPETGEPSQTYLDWRQKQRGKWDAENEEWEYSYDEGVAP